MNDPSTGSAVQDQEVLLDFFRSTGGESWKNRHGWASNEDVGTWFGVTTNDEGRVVCVSLLGNNLRGESRSFKGVEPPRRG